MYSQYDEERHILSYFQKINFSVQPRFLDIGACDGVTFSNTYQLYLNQWNATYVEPDPTNLKSLHINAPGALIAPVAIVAQSGKITFHTTSQDQVHNLKVKVLGTTNLDHIAKWQSDKVKFESIEVDALSTKDFLVKYPGPYHFINLDIEGANLDILRTLPLKELDTQLICVEHDGHRKEVEQYCSKHGLGRMIYWNGVNMLMGVK